MISATIMDSVISTCKVILHHFLVFNENAFFYIIYFLKTYWCALFVIAAIALLFCYEVQEINDKYVDDQRNIL